MRIVAWLLAAALLAGAALCFSTCRRETSGGRAEITLFCWPFSTLIQLNRERIAIFEAENPDIKVRLVTGHEDKYLTMVTAGVAPDVAGTDYGYIFYYANRKSILPLDDFVAADAAKREAILALDKIADTGARREAIMALDESIADAAARQKAVSALNEAVAADKQFSCAEYFNVEKYFSLDKYFPAAVKSMRYGGKLYALPDNGSPVALIYNKEMFEEYNRRNPDKPLTFPSEKWTRADFRHAAKALTRDINGDGQTDVYGCTLGFHRNRFPMYIWQNGGEVISKDKRRCLIDSPEAIAAMQWMYEILWVDKSSPTYYTQIAGVTEQSESMRFREERIAMMLTTRYAYGDLLKKTTFKWDIAPVPRGPVNGVSLYICGGPMISTQTLHKEKAWRLARFLVGDRSCEMAMLAGRGLTCNRVVAEKMLLRPDTIPPHDYYWIDIMKESRPKDFEFRVGMGSYFDRAMNEIYYLPQRRRTPEQACRNCARIFNQGLKIFWEEEDRL